MSLWMRMATRFMWSRRKGGLLSLLSIVSLIGVTLGIMIPIIAISILNGLQDHIKVRLVAMQGEVIVKVLPRFRRGSNFWIENPQDLVALLEKEPEVKRAYSCYSTEGVLVYKSSWKPLMVYGVPQEFLREDEKVGQYYSLIEGDKDISGVQKVNVGVELGSTLNIRKDDRARLLIFPKGETTLIAKEIPVKVSGLFKTGLLDYDHTALYTSTETIQRFLEQPNRATEIRVRLANGVSIKKAIDRLQSILLEEEQDLVVFSWEDFHKNLLLSLEVETLGIWIVMFFILLVGVFNIVGSQILLITEKKREIGILKTMGMTPREIRNIFLAEGILLTTLGSIIGGTLGCVLSVYINGIMQGIESGINGIWGIVGRIFVEEVDWIRLIPEGVYYLEGIPVSFEGKTVLIIVGTALIFTVFASLIPTYRAANESVIDSIQSQE